MTNKNLYKYTDENYLTRSELRVAMRSNLINDFWREILEYRRANAEKTPLIGVNRSPFSITKTEATSARLIDFESRLQAYSSAMSDLALNPSAQKIFEKESFFSVLNEAGKLISNPLPELTVKAMLNGFFRPGENEKEALLWRFLENLKAKHSAPSEESLGELRFALLGHDEVSNFYRTSDFRSIYTTQVVARNYTYAPYGEIEGMMDSFFAFLSSSSYKTGLKSLLCLYYIYIVKPFEENNELIATSFARSLLSYNGVEGAAYLPFETLLQESAKLKDVLSEVQEQKDLTFFAFYCIEKLNAFFERSLSRLASLKRETVTQEFIEIPKEERDDTPLKEQTSSPSEDEAKTEETPPEAPEPKPDKVPLLSEEERKSFLESRGKNAIFTPSASLSDKEVKETARYLLETNPLLRKKQALFYASHCTLGRFYTIQDFKKATRCAYETARTSMDGLVELGFYTKKQIKNKFVYTPIRQGDNK